MEELSWCWYGEWSWERRSKTNVSGLAYIGISCCSVRLLRHHWLCCLSSKVHDTWQRGKQNIILKFQLLIKFREEESKTMLQVLLRAFKIQTGKQNKSLSSLDDLGTTFQTGKQNKLSSLDGLQHFRQDRQNNVSLKSGWLTTFQTGKQNNLSQVLMPYNISDRKAKQISLKSWCLTTFQRGERQRDHTLAMNLQKENKKPCTSQEEHGNSEKEEE